MSMNFFSLKHGFLKMIYLDEGISPPLCPQSSFPEVVDWNEKWANPVHSACFTVNVDQPPFLFSSFAPRTLYDVPIHKFRHAILGILRRSL